MNPWGLVVFAPAVKCQLLLGGHFAGGACLYIDEHRVDLTLNVRRLERIPENVTRVTR